MVRCDMCGMEVPGGPNGTCFLGHRLGSNAALSVAAAFPTHAVPSVPAAISVPSAPSAIDGDASATSLPSSPPSFGPGSSISPDLIAAVVAEVESAPKPAPPTMPVTAPAGAGAPSGFTVPRPLGGMPTTAPAPIPVAASVPPQVPVPTLASTLDGTAARQAPFAASTPIPVGAPTPLPVSPSEPQSSVPGTPGAFSHGSAAVALDPLPAPDPLPASRDLFVVAQNPARLPNKTLMVVVALVVLAAAVFGAKALLSGDPATPRASTNTGAVLAPTLVRTFAGGEAHSYRLKAQIDSTAGGGTQSESGSMAINVRFTERVVERTAGGDVALRYTFDEVSLSENGEPAATPLKAGASMIVKVGPDGKVKSVESLGLPDGMNASFTDLLAPVLPPHAKPGSRWSRVDNVGVPNFDEKLRMKTSFRLVRFDGGNAVVASTSEAPFSFTMNGPQLARGTGGAAPATRSLTMQGRMLATGTQVVDRATGRTVSAAGEIALTFAMLADGSELGRVAMKMKLTLAPAQGVAPTTA